MTRLFSGCCLAALVAVSGTAARAAECDFLCRVESYVQSDHMVALAPAPESETAGPRASDRRKPKAAVVKAVATKVVANRPAPAGPAPAKTLAAAAAPVPAAPPAVPPRRVAAPARIAPAKTAPSVAAAVKAPAAKLPSPSSIVAAAPLPHRLTGPVRTARAEPVAPVSAARPARAPGLSLLIPGGAPVVGAQFSPSLQ